MQLETAPSKLKVGGANGDGLRNEPFVATMYLYAAPLPTLCV